jgi:hypothetical protein
MSAALTDQERKTMHPAFSPHNQPPRSQREVTQHGVPSGLNLSASASSDSELLVHGAVRVSRLEDAAVILKPSVHFVVVSRAQWIEGRGNFIHQEIGAFLQEASRTHEALQYPNNEMHSLSDLPVWLRRFLTSDSRREALSLLSADFNEIGVWFRHLTEATKPYSCLRVEFKDNSPGDHFDAQSLTCGCCYSGGGTLIHLHGGQTLQLRAGEIGLWKGAAREDEYGQMSYNLLDASASIVNEGQAVLHGAPQGAAGYPRFATFHDVRDERVAPVLRKSLVPWVTY